MDCHSIEAHHLHQETNELWMATDAFGSRRRAVWWRCACSLLGGTKPCTEKSLRYNTCLFQLFGYTDISSFYQAHWNESSDDEANAPVLRNLPGRDASTTLHTHTLRSCPHACWNCHDHVCTWGGASREAHNQGHFLRKQQNSERRRDRVKEKQLNCHRVDTSCQLPLYWMDGPARLLVTIEFHEVCNVCVQLT